MQRQTRGGSTAQAVQSLEDGRALPGAWERPAAQEEEVQGAVEQGRAAGAAIISGAMLLKLRRASVGTEYRPARRAWPTERGGAEAATPSSQSARKEERKLTDFLSKLEWMEVERRITEKRGIDT